MKENTPPKRGPGRPPAPPVELAPTTIAEIRKLAKELARDPAKLKAWLKPKRIEHVILQHELATMPIPGGQGIALNASASKLFLEVTEPLAAALEGVEDPDDEQEQDGVVEPPRRKGRR